MQFWTPASPGVSYSLDEGEMNGPDTERFVLLRFYLQHVQFLKNMVLNRDI